MARIITITSGKGGVGKTTATVNIAAAFAARGRKVLAIDGDVGLRNLDIAFGVQNDVVYDFVDILDGRIEAARALVKCKENLYLLSSPQILERNVTPSEMIKLCAFFDPSFDYILIDCPAGIGAEFKNAIAPAELALIVTTTDIIANRDADRVVGILEKANIPQMLLINKIDKKLIKKEKAVSVSDIVETLAVDVLGIIPYDDKAAVNATEVVAYDRRCRAGKAYSNIVRRLEGESVALSKI